jgi:hypothetical protein
MHTVYVISAMAGGTVLVLQTILLVIGGDTDTTDADVGDVHGDIGHDDVSVHDAHEATFLKVLSFKTVVSFFTFFGLAGLAAMEGGFLPFPTFLIATGAGTVALYIVAYLMSALSRLQSRGNIQIANAVGGIGRVYLRIPGERSGEGKVTVVVQGRAHECKASTAGPEIATGMEVEVVGTAGPNVLDVVPMRKE